MDVVRKLCCRYFHATAAVCLTQLCLKGAYALLPIPVAACERPGNGVHRGALLRHPGLLINAVNNTVYWVALAFVLREPLGVVLVVLSFLLAGFLVAPFERVVGLSDDPGADALVRDQANGTRSKPANPSTARFVDATG